MATKDAADEFDINAKPAPEKAKEEASSGPSAAQTKTKLNLPKPGPPKPQVQKPAEQKAAEEKVSIPLDPLPKTFEETQKLVEKLSRLPERTVAEEKVKKARLSRVQAHWFKLQQGLPVLAIDANGIAGVAKKQTGLLKSDRVKFEARNNPIVRELVKENAALKELVDELNAQVTKLTQENAALKAK